MEQHYLQQSGNLHLTAHLVLVETISKKGAYKNMNTTPSPDFLKDTLFSKETISLIKKEDNLINSFFLPRRLNHLEKEKEFPLSGLIIK